MNMCLFSLCLIAVFGNFAHSIAVNESKKLNYRLSTDIEPLDYIIDVTPYFDDVPGKELFTFDGITTITIKAKNSNIDTITLHKLNLVILEEGLIKKSKQFSQKVERINIKSHEYDDRTQKYTLKLASTLVKDELYVLTFKYTGSLTSGKGFYATLYKEGNVMKYLASTHMEPANSRKMFPNFDEPRFKATFSIIVNRPAHFKPSISNMPLLSSHNTSSNLVREYFQKSPMMSSYLVAVVVSEFECRENALKNYSICYSPSTRDQSEYSFNFGQKVLKTFDKVFDYPYNVQMPKISMAAVPFFGGGMENWGLIIYGANRLMVDLKSATPKTIRSTAGLIAHEVAHMWFGDLVTCDWWSNTWLNEGFATYFETFGLDLIEPKWNVDQQFIVDKLHPVMSDDSLESSLPLNYDANTSDELHGRFGSITYSKGGSVIRMFKYILGNDKFISGLRNYFKQNALKTTVPENLYLAFQNEVKDELNVTDIFDSWVSQPGFPVLNVHLSNDRKHIEIRQKRYLDSGPSHEDKTQYKVPLTWASNNENTDFSYTKPMAMLSNTSLKIELKKPIDWIVFNVQHAGYYRVNYDDSTWSAIAKILHKSYTTVHVLNRAQIVDDVLKLARFSYSNYETALRVINYLQNELDYIPWKSAFVNFDFILARLKPNEELLFTKFELKLLDKVYKHLGFHSKANDKLLDFYNRIDVVKYACQAGLKLCLTDARTEFDDFVKGNYTIPVDFVAVVYRSAVEYGTDTEWNYLLNKFKSSNLDDEREVLLKAMGYTTRADLLKKYFEFILSKELPFEYRRTALLSTLNQKQNLHLVLDFVFAYHKAIRDAVRSMDVVAELLSNLASSSTSYDEVSSIEKFVQENGLYEKVKTALEKAKLNLKWASKNVPTILSTIKNILKTNN